MFRHGDWFIHGNDDPVHGGQIYSMITMDQINKKTSFGYWCNDKVKNFDISVGLTGDKTPFRKGDVIVIQAIVDGGPPFDVHFQRFTQNIYLLSGGMLPDEFEKLGRSLYDHSRLELRYSGRRWAFPVSNNVNVLLQFMKVCGQGQ